MIISIHVIFALLKYSNKRLFLIDVVKKQYSHELTINLLYDYTFYIKFKLGFPETNEQQC